MKHYYLFSQDMNSTLASVAVVALLIGGGIGYALRTPTQSPESATNTMPERASQTAALGAAASADEKIANAVSAAPESVSRNAAVLDLSQGSDPTLRKGTNEWTCLPDDQNTPGNDPVCVDAEAMKWFQAYLTKTKPKLAQAGLAYMLQGGSDPSNTDPFATKPAAGEDWMNAPPHVMIFPTTPPDPKVYGTDMDSGGPWVMWANTPYAHLMMPVK